MKKIYTLFALTFCLCTSAQTTLYTNDFTAGGGGFTLGQGGNFDFWIVNNVYSCTSTTPNQGGGNYMHIYDDLFGDYCAHSGFLGSGSGGTVYSTMNSGIVTTGSPNVTLTFDWLCQGQTGPVLASFGFVDFSTDGGLSWTNCALPLAKYNGQSTWTTGSISTTQYPAMGNKADLRFRFGFTNSGYGTNPAFSIDNISVIDAVTTSLAENKSENSFSVFPNPTKGIFTLSLSSVNENAGVVTITDVLGKTVSTKQIAANTNAPIAIDLTGQEKGVYFVRVVNGGKVAVKKIVLE
ncbi:MAG: T9SS type A sorting domain-containing protein [Bacteroidia bacterium]|nr:T9SS type A sorting domain-containing protein [Bacteroidia bacterium]